jgi:hypothetical protein
MPRLFSELDLRSILQHQERTMLEEIEGMHRDEFLGRPPDALQAYFVEKFDVNPLQLRRSEARAGRRA